MIPARDDSAVRAIDEPAPAAKRTLGLVAPSPPAVKARQLLDEARNAASDHLAALESPMLGVRGLAAAAAEDEALYGPGLTAFAGRLAEDLFWRSKALAVLAQKQRQRFAVSP